MNFFNINLNNDAFIANLGIDFIELVPPINSIVCCVKRADKQWAAFKFGEKTPIVDFGKYNHMWGFDSGYCLVSVADKDRTSFANRGIIDSRGNELVKPYTYRNIFNFYGREEPEITVFTEDGVVGLDRKNPSIVINNNPFGRWRIVSDAVERRIVRNKKGTVCVNLNNIL